VTPVHQSNPLLCGLDGPGDPEAPPQSIHHGQSSIHLRSGAQSLPPTTEGVGIVGQILVVLTFTTKYGARQTTPVTQESSALIAACKMSAPEPFVRCCLMPLGVKARRHGALRRKKACAVS
jgi:hypothetical protein